MCACAAEGWHDFVLIEARCRLHPACHVVFFLSPAPLRLVPFLLPLLLEAVVMEEEEEEEEKEEEQIFSRLHMSERERDL